MPINYSFYAIPATWVVGMSSHWYAIYLTQTGKGIPPFDNSDVRSFQSKVASMDRKNPVRLSSARYVSELLSDL